MLKQILSVLPAVSMLLGTPQFARAAELTPSAPVNVYVPAAAMTYSSISIMWDKPQNYKQIQATRYISTVILFLLPRQTKHTIRLII